ncbi:polymer-forming cytoskeletal protein [Salmonella enterica]|nr:polymer-forming cytoskeletal protein [Salmonella enterica]EDM5312999.1 hypothetical protein [Salmonella enterica subsp. enterica serovar Weltevreden]EHB3750988.1 polymer-forming cytoskeletal protein [Salmonella enterica subsp. enterica serovar Newport]EHM9697357.1 polymer-forming cytoskeletal protein [Salmonella enterica subsp. enterica serovar 4,[5],12,[27]:-:1,2]EIQ8263640.1 polymer-forming cytoskeletal protein [Salmonella enterica subsp. enterica serovar Bareilly]HCS9252603.1 polymer-for
MTYQPVCRPVLCFVYVLWVGGLVARLANLNVLALGLLAVALFFLAGVFLPLSGGRMIFSRKRLLTTISNKPVDGQEPAMIDVAPPLDHGLTVIASGAVVEGDILQGENVAIYGLFTGDIRLPRGEISIHYGGCVRGNLSASMVLIDGHMEGVCEAQTVTILENGVLHGVCRSVIFSIIPGGEFIGTAEASQKEDILDRDGQTSGNAEWRDGENKAQTICTSVQQSLEEEKERNATSILCE